MQNRFCGISLAAALFAAAAPPAGADTAGRFVTPAIPPAAALVVESAMHAVNAHRPEAVARFAAAGSRDSFAWAAAQGREWKADVLPVPGTPSQPPLFLA